MNISCILMCIGSYHMSLTMIDALDTMIIMGVDDRYIDECEQVISSLNFNSQENINVFETIIRVIGGLLSSYSLTGREIFKKKSIELASSLLFAFDSSSHLPYGTVGLSSHSKYNPSWSGGSSTVAEVGSIQLELAFLSYITNDNIYKDKGEKVYDILNKLNVDLYPQFISVDSGQFTSHTITFGARVDSLYEYLLKLHILTDQDSDISYHMYEKSMNAMNQILIKRTKPYQGSSSNVPLTYIAGNQLFHSSSLILLTNYDSCIHYRHLICIIVSFNFTFLAFCSYL